MMTLVTGLPGRGKTLYAVQLIREAVTAGRKVYSDIEGLKIPVESIPDDWRDTPPGSLIVYDEAHRRFPSSGRAGPSPDEQVNRLDTHRHSGHDFVFVTQYPGKLHKVIRDLVDRHVHLVRAMGLQGALLHEWGFCQASPESPTARREADKLRWKFPRDLYRMYTSASTHSRYNAIQMPPRAIWLVIGTVFLIFLLWRIASSFQDRIADSSGETVAAAFTPSVLLTASPPVAPVGAPGDIRGCITLGYSCRCFGDEMAVLVVDQWDCIMWSADPWSIRPVPYVYTPPPMYVPPLPASSGSAGQGSSPSSSSSGSSFLGGGI